MKHISKRDEISRNGIREIMELVMEMDDVIQLQVGEPVINTPDFVKEGAIKAINDNYSRYTANAGFPSLREAICGRIATNYGAKIGLDNVIVSPGAVAAINIMLYSIVDEKEEVLIPNPSYPNYDALVRIQGAIPIYYSTPQKLNYSPDVNDIKRKITSKTRAIIINSPNNPTGAVYSKQTLKEIVNVAEQHKLYIISDEIYDDLTLEGTFNSILSVGQNYLDHIIAIYGFSKTFAMTGWRLGYAIIPAHLYKIAIKLQEPVYTCASSISQKAGEAALLAKESKKFINEMKGHYLQKRDVVCEILDEEGLPYVKPKGAFYIPIDISKTNMTSKEFAIQLLEEQGVAVAPCETFGPSGEKLIRICFAGDLEELLVGVKRLCHYYKKVIVS